MHSTFLSVRSSCPGGKAEGEACFCNSHIGEILLYQIPAAERVAASQQPIAGMCAKWSIPESQEQEGKDRLLRPHLPL